MVTPEPTWGRQGHWCPLLQTCSVSPRHWTWTLSNIGLRTHADRWWEAEGGRGSCKEAKSCWDHNCDLKTVAAYWTLTPCQGAVLCGSHACSCQASGWPALRYHVPILRRRKLRLRDVTWLLDCGRPGIGARASRSASRKFFTTWESSPHLLSVSECGFS